MAKFTEVSDELQERFNEIRNKQTSLPDFIKIKLLNNEKQKDIYSPAKANGVIEYLNEIEFLIFVNEDLFDKLDDEARDIIEEALAYVGFDQDKEIVSKATPDYTTFSGLQSKYDKKLSRAKELVRTLIQQKADEAKDQKEKGKAGKKPFKA
jgi:TRAP-type C4-dicarboxylate transport system substrate-binding protein